MLFDMLRRGEMSCQIGAGERAAEGMQRHFGLPSHREYRLLGGHHGGIHLKSGLDMYSFPIPYRTREATKQQRREEQEGYESAGVRASMIEE